MLKQLRNWVAVFWMAGKRLIQEQYTYRASALAFTTLIAIVPLVSVVLSVVTIFPMFTRLTTLAQNYIFTNFIPTSSQLVQEYLQNFIDQAAHLPTFGIVFLLFTAITLIIMVEHTLNTIWSAPKRKKKLTTMLIYWLILLLMPIILGLSVFISSFIFSLSWFSGTAKKLGVMIPLLASLPLFINTLIFSALYIAVPNVKVRFSDGLLGGFAASFLFEAAKKGFAFYILHFPSYELIYGTLATIPIFLVWVYISWLIVLYGALVTHTRHLQKHPSHSHVPL
jgi:membrane protein